jgi:hypothetical protein
MNSTMHRYQVAWLPLGCNANITAQIIYETCRAYWHLTPRSRVKISRRFGTTYRLHVQGRGKRQPRNQNSVCCMRILCLIHSSTLKMEEICSSIIKFDFHRVTRRYITDYITLQSHLCRDCNQLYEASLNMGF